MDVAILVDIIKETDKNWRFIFESPLYDDIKFPSGQLVQLLAKPYAPLQENIKPQQHSNRAQAHLWHPMPT